MTRRCPGLCECLSFARLHFQVIGVFFFFGLVFLFHDLFCVYFSFVR